MLTFSIFQMRKLKPRRLTNSYKVTQLMKEAGTHAQGIQTPNSILIHSFILSFIGKNVLHAPNVPSTGLGTEHIVMIKSFILLFLFLGALNTEAGIH